MSMNPLDNPTPADPKKFQQAEADEVQGDFPEPPEQQDVPPEDEDYPLPPESPVVNDVQATPAPVSPVHDASTADMVTMPEVPTTEPEVDDTVYDGLVTAPEPEPAMESMAIPQQSDAVSDDVMANAPVPPAGDTPDAPGGLDDVVAGPAMDAPQIDEAAFPDAPGVANDSGFQFAPDGDSEPPTPPEIDTSNTPNMFTAPQGEFGSAGGGGQSNVEALLERIADAIERLPENIATHLEQMARL